MLIFGILLAVLLVLGVVVGKFFATWLLVVISVLLGIYMRLIWKDIRRPNSLPGTSGKLGADIIGFGLMICIILFMSSVWITYYLSK